MSDRQIGTTARQLIDTKKLIEDKKNWCSGIMRDANGRMCLAGAVAAALGVRDYADICCTPAYRALIAAVHATYGKETRPVAVNDNYGHGAVMKLLDIAISKELSIQG